jgi:hypothetical protein
MAATCTNCGAPLGLARRARHKSLCESCEQKQEAAQNQARGRLDEVLAEFAGGQVGGSLIPALEEAADHSGLTPEELTSRKIDALARYALTATADDLLSEEEEARLQSLASALDVTYDQFRQTSGMGERLVITAANAGRLPVYASTSLMTKPGEVVHLEWPASLMKEVTLREFRAGYQGFSFPIGKTGIRYRVGGARGHSVVVGTQLQLADTGPLVVSSIRSVFLGARKTMEMPHAKLLGLDVFTDGVRFHLSNRQNAPLFQVPNGEVVAAIVNAAAPGGS